MIWHELARLLQRLMIRTHTTVCQVYCAFDPDGQQLAEWIFNHSVGRDSLWKRVAADLLPPLLLPQGLRHLVTVFKCPNAVEELVPAAIREGINLSRAQLWELHLVERFNLPAKGKGSGKNGSIVKGDLAKACVEHYWPKASEEETLWMFQQLMGAKAVIPCAEELLDAIEELEPKAKQEWDSVKTMCQEMCKSQKSQQKHFKKTPPASVPPECVTAKDSGLRDAEIPKDMKDRMPSDSTYEHKTYTPPTLQSLIPGRGDLPYVYLKRIIGSRNSYQGFYPGSWTALRLLL